MLQKIHKYRFQILMLLPMIFLLVCIRIFENQLFYDPFLVFFKNEFQNLPFPKANNFQLGCSLLFRYFLNTAISLSIIYVLFNEKELVQFASIMYLVFFVILLVLFFLTLHFANPNHYLVLFYIRRFIIQPLFLLLFVPAFYYQNSVSKK